MVKEVGSFEEFLALANSGKAVFFYFWATWCGPCKLLSPIYEKFARESSTPEIEFYRINIDDQERAGVEARVKSMPTIVLYKDGTLLDSFIGAIPRKLERLVAKAVESVSRAPEPPAVSQPVISRSSEALADTQLLETQSGEAQQSSVIPHGEVQQSEANVRLSGKPKF